MWYKASVESGVPFPFGVCLFRLFVEEAAATMFPPPDALWYTTLLFLASCCGGGWVFEEVSVVSAEDRPFWFVARKQRRTKTAEKMQNRIFNKTTVTICLTMS